MLATLKAGGAFVPIEPSQPVPRLRGIITELQPPVILTSTTYASLCSKSLATDHTCDITTLPISNLWFQELKFNPIAKSSSYTTIQATPLNTAYAIFTSGSTGIPKAVLLRHEAVVSSSSAYGNALGFGSTSRVLNFSANVFDAVIAEVITTLIFGGCVCVPSDFDRLNQLELAMRRMKGSTSLVLEKNYSQY